MNPSRKRSQLLSSRTHNFQAFTEYGTIAEAQASLDAFCSRTGDKRLRRRDGQRSIVGAIARAEPLGPLPAAFPATVTVSRRVSAQALVAFRGNSYSVPPGLGGRTVVLTHRLGARTLDIATATASASAIVLARHERQPDGAGVVLRDDVHVAALQTAVLAAFDTSAPCPRKVRRPPSPAALAEAEQLRRPARQDDCQREVVVDLNRYARAARERQVAP